MLTKQQKLDVLSKAIDEGADIRISFHQGNRSRAAVLTTELAGMMETTTTGKTFDDSFWYEASIPGFDVVAFYDPTYMIEDVKFEEEEVEL